MTTDELYSMLLDFAKQCQKLIKKLSYTVYNKEYSEQLIRSSSSPGANYIEAIEAVSRKDFTYRLKICRKEAKESIHWLALIQTSNENDIDLNEEAQQLIDQAQRFIRIFTASILTLENKRKTKNR